MDDLRAKGNDFFKKKQFKEAIEQYTKAIELCEPNSENIGTISSNKAACHIQLKNYDDAVCVYFCFKTLLASSRLLTFLFN